MTFILKSLGDLLLELLVEAAFEFADLAAAKAGDVDVVARAVAFVIVAVAAKMEEVELVDEALFFEEVDGAVNGDEMNAGIDFLGALEDLVDIEMLLGGVHHFENDAALASQANFAFTNGLLKLSGGLGGVEALAGRNAVGRRCGHEVALLESGALQAVRNDSQSAAKCHCT